MKCLKFSFFILTAIMLLCSTSYATSSSIIKNQKLELSLSLLKENIEKTDDNFIVSPFSIYMIADMLANGANGKTLQGLQEKILDKTGKFSLKDITSALVEEMKDLSPITKTNNPDEEETDTQKEPQKAKNSMELMKFAIERQAEIIKQLEEAADNEERIKIAKQFQDEILAMNNSLPDENFAIESKQNNIAPSSAIEINNSIWGNHFKDEYKEIIKSLYTEIFSLPSNTSEINNWIENKTHGMITQILEPEPTTLNDLYLVNTVYFKDKWKQPFNKENTKQKKFYSLHKILPDSVNMMYQKKYVNYYENSHFQAIRLFYQTDNHIDIILPKRYTNFKKFINSLTLNDLNFSYEEKEVRISLPRFDTEYAFDLKNFIKDLNIPMFKEDKDLDFLAMCTEKCYIEKILHKAKIQLDEEGTTAAAATVVTSKLMGIKARRSTPKVFNANHPFIYIINDGLFIGAYTKGELVE